MISEHDRTRMRDEAERVMASHPSTFSDAHLMAVFVVTLLDDTEAWIGGTDAESDERRTGG